MAKSARKENELQKQATLPPGSDTQIRKRTGFSCVAYL